MLSRRRVLYILVIAMIVSLCLWHKFSWIGRDDEESRQRSKWLSGILSSSLPVTNSNGQEFGREWSYEHLEQLRQLMSLTEETIAKKARELDGIDSDGDKVSVTEQENSEEDKTDKLSSDSGFDVDGEKSLAIDTGENGDLEENVSTIMLTEPIFMNNKKVPGTLTEGKVHTEPGPTVSLDAAAIDQETGALESANETETGSGDINPHNSSEVDSMLLAALSSLSDIQEGSPTQQKIEVVDFNATSKIKDFIKLIPPPKNLPWNKKQLLISSKNVYDRRWVKDLQHFLQYSYDPMYPVTLVSTNQLFVESVINWLIHSLVVLKNPLKNILVLTMDEGVYGFLKNRSINTICVPAAGNIRIDRPKHLSSMVQVEAARLLVLRMLNHWGVDVINYDNDAIVLKNPQPLLDGELSLHDVIGSEGFMPYDLHDRWGVTLCFGFFLIRATPATKKLWDEMCSLDVNDDQKKFNYALSSLQLKWHNRSSSNDFWRGNTKLHTVSVAVFPLSKMCRGPKHCYYSQMEQYYIWHKGGGHVYNAMVKGSQKAKLWLVKPEWWQISGEGKTAEEWLRSVANLGG